jgi:hypothetical protein
MSHVSAMSSVLKQRARLPQHVVHRQFAEETVVLNLKTGYYHGLNATGGRMLEVLGESETVGAAARSLADEYAQPISLIEEDLSAFCAALVERDLLELHAAA